MRAGEMIKEPGMPTIQWVSSLRTARTDLWEDSQITRYVLFGPGLTRRYGVTCLQWSCQQPINYCVFSSPNGLSVYIYIYSSLIENSYLKFTCTHFPESLRNQSSLLQAPRSFKTASATPRNSTYPEKLPSLFSFNLSGDEEGEIETPFLRDTSPPLLISGLSFGCVSKIIFLTICQGADGKSVFPIS